MFLAATLISRYLIGWLIDFRFMTFVYLAGNGELHLEPGEMLALYVLEVKVVCGVVTRSSCPRKPSGMTTTQMG